MHYLVSQSRLQGEVLVPPSKSHTLRAILFASLATGKSTIHSYLESPDTNAMISACRQLGAKIKKTDLSLIIEGVASSPSTPKNVIDAGNSGQVLRFISAIASLIPGYTVVTGDQSVRENRPISPLLSGINQLGAFAESISGTGYAPVKICGPLLGGVASIEGSDSQPVSGLIMAAAFSSQVSEIHVVNPGEKPWVDLTLAWLDKLNIPYEREGYEVYRLFGNARYSGFDYTVPGDFSSAAFPMVAALLTGSSLTLNNLSMTDVQGDKAIITILKDMGANIEIDEINHQIKVLKSPFLKGMKFDINHCIDAIAILSVIACFALGETQISGAAIARKKESDRISVMAGELRKMGANIKETEDGLIIRQSSLNAAVLESHGDHRVAMALTIAAMTLKSESKINHVECVNKSYPLFHEVMQSLGAHVLMKA